MLEPNPKCPYAAQFGVHVTDRYRGAPRAARCFCGSVWDFSDPDVSLFLWLVCHTSEYSVVRVESLEPLLRMPYPEYLGTLHWQRVRALKIEEAHHTCQMLFCGARARQVHHVLYRRGEERLEDLLAVCRACHAAVHGERHRAA